MKNEQLDKYVEITKIIQQYYCPRCKIAIHLEEQKPDRRCPLCNRDILQHINKDRIFKYYGRVKNHRLQEYDSKN